MNPLTPPQSNHNTPSRPLDVDSEQPASPTALRSRLTATTTAGATMSTSTSTSTFTSLRPEELGSAAGEDSEMEVDARSDQALGAGDDDDEEEEEDDSSSNEREDGQDRIDGPRLLGGEDDDDDDEETSEEDQALRFDGEGDVEGAISEEEIGRDAETPPDKSPKSAIDIQSGKGQLPNKSGPRSKTTAKTRSKGKSNSKIQSQTSGMVGDDGDGALPEARVAPTGKEIRMADTSLMDRLNRRIGDVVGDYDPSWD